jgi:hypothetical protein
MRYEPAVIRHLSTENRNELVNGHEFYLFPVPALGKLDATF